jgi:hypothetical protein
MLSQLLICTVLLLVTSASELRCKPGEWRGVDLTRGEVCSTCLPGRRCDGHTMTICPAGTRNIGAGNSNCCPTDMQCPQGAVSRYSDGCMCKPIRGPLAQGPGGDYERVERDCKCPQTQQGIFVQTTDCQCVLGKACSGQVWERGDGGYHCLKFL